MSFRSRSSDYIRSLQGTVATSDEFACCRRDARCSRRLQCGFKGRALEAAVNDHDVVYKKRSGPEYGEGGERDDKGPLGSYVDACRIDALTSDRSRGAGVSPGDFSSALAPHARLVEVQAAGHVQEPQAAARSFLETAATGLLSTISATTHAAKPASASPHPTHPVEVQPKPAAIAKPPSQGPSAFARLKAE